MISRTTLLILVVPALAFAYAEGPDAAVSGVPGELGTCTACHSGGSGSGSVKLAFPGDLTYTPGTKQHLIVTVADPAQGRWGFQATVRQASNTKNQAGTLTPTDGNTQNVCTQPALQTEKFGNKCTSSSTPLEYIEHTLSGTRNGTRNQVTFEFDWTPPATAMGDLTFYVVGNAANGDGSQNGDHIYTAKYTLTVAAPPAPPAPAISQNGVINAAGLGTDFAALTWTTIQGTNLANTTRSYTPDDIVNGNLPTQLDGVGVTIDGTPAVMLSISPTQLTVLSPPDNNTGPVQVVVTNNGTAGPPATITLQAAAPEFFAWNSKYAVLTTPDVTTPPDLNNPPVTQPTVQPGATVVLWATGFGPANPVPSAGQLVPADQPYSATNTPVVTIGGVQTQVMSTVLAPGSASLYAVTVVVPDSLSDGDQPVSVQVTGIQSTGTANVSVKN
jgi:uncharacterized protein (TIGR03437 family)